MKPTDTLQKMIFNFFLNYKCIPPIHIQKVSIINLKKLQREEVYKSSIEKYVAMPDPKYEELEFVPTERTALRPASTKSLETLDDALPHVGDFGRYQLYLLLALFPYSVAYASLYFSQFFFTLVPREHWCRIEELMDVFPAELR